MIRPPRACIFDLDGTLLDSVADIAAAGNAALREHRFPAHPVEAYRIFVGNGMDVMVRRAAPEGTDPAILSSLLLAAKAHYAKAWNVHTRPYPGMKELVDALFGKSVPMAVLTNKPHEFAGEMIDFFFPEKPFRFVYGHRPSVPVKPHPEPALALAKEFGVAPADVFFFGDSRVDMETAVNAGMRAVGVTWGFRSREELLQYGARHLLDKAEDFWKIEE